ncbi:MAG: cbb3-type cytochrome oxidase assembly protein CcoS [bacterium]
MEVLYILIAASLLLAGGFLVVFLWAVKSVQFEDTYTPSIRMLYNTGRVLTYSVLGILVGFAGETTSLAGYQQGLSLFLGITLLLVAIFSSGWLRNLFVISEKIAGTWRKITGYFFRKNSFRALIGIGILNGFLPCGLVYVALVGAAATSGVAAAVGFMLAFGLGTFPAMLTISLGRQFIGAKRRRSIQRLIPIATAVLAIILVLCGLSLGIPYLSPDLQNKNVQIEPHGH